MSGDVVCSLHKKMRSTDLLIEPQNQGRWFVNGLVLKSLGQFISGLPSKSLGRFVNDLVSKPLG
jgi:hypothetical protein